ncbi:potassium transporter [Macleaya cordata]|uniref:Potassium transporter n=1 Tax=Macleaya cordata TaxID=56857 RepID=A0A200QFU2_MACCD|nr:potassium transporter [Macleaya cordata]
MGGSTKEDHHQEEEEEEEVEDIESRMSPSSNKGGSLEAKPSFTDIYKLPNREHKEYPLKQTLMLAFQSIGVVYGDLGTSPLYVFPSMTLANPTDIDILGFLSLIFWTFTSLGLIKYVCIVLHADDQGEGGTFALYSLLCQHVNFRNRIAIQNTRLPSDKNLKFYSSRADLQTKAKQFLEDSSKAQSVLIFVVLLGTCMVIGDGALTPAISVLSAVQGIQSRSSKITQNDVVMLSAAILVILFIFQRFGTSKVSKSFSPIMIMWFVSNACIGIYNIATYYPSIFKVISPHYIYYFFAKNGKIGWELLGAVVLCITGTEAMFADLGHFNKKAIQLAFSCVVYPACLLTYAGQGAFLIKNPEKMSTAYYSAIPSPIFWPMFVIATLAAIVASQALISASFSIIRQSMALGCFPRVNMIHTSTKHEGQVYSPEVNYFLMVACILIVVFFKGGVEIGNAYGVAVIWVMLITTCLMTVVMLVIWNTNIALILLFFLFFLLIEGPIMTALLTKLPQGGWVPFVISMFLLIVMLSWTYGRSKKSEYEAARKMKTAELTQLVSNQMITRVPGICFFCTDLVNGIPPIIRHYVQTVSSLRDIMVIVTIRTLPIKSVLPEERFLVGKLGPKGVYRCLVQYGYMDVPDMQGEEYIASVVDKLKEETEEESEIRALESAASKGVVFVLGRTILKSNEKNGCLAHVVIDYFYRFLQKNFRSAVSTLNVPPGKLLQVGMLYEI